MRKRAGLAGAGDRGSAGRILVVRNDRLGDFMLAWPSFGTLKASLPDAEIHVLVPRYTADLAAMCPWVDGTVLDPGRGSGPAAALQLARRIRSRGFDATIVLFSTGRVALITLLAGIPYRLAPATKPAQLLYTHRLRQRRSRSEKPEFEYNLDLVRVFLRHREVTPVAVGPPYLSLDPSETAALRAELCTRLQLDSEQRLVFVHPGTGGSSPGLSPAALARLVTALESSDGHAVIVTAGPGERELAGQVAGAIMNRGGTARVLHSTESLADFARQVAIADVFVSGSTGPLHLAGALNRPTAAFYPRTRAMSALRWQTLNSEERRVAFQPPPGAAAHDLDAIDLEAAARTISRRFLAEGVKA